MHYQIAPALVASPSRAGSPRGREPCPRHRPLAPWLCCSRHCLLGPREDTSRREVRSVHAPLRCTIPAAATRPTDSPPHSRYRGGEVRVTPQPETTRKVQPMINILESLLAGHPLQNHVEPSYPNPIASRCPPRRPREVRGQTAAHACTSRRRRHRWPPSKSRPHSWNGGEPCGAGSISSASPTAAAARCAAAAGRATEPWQG